MLQLFQSIFGSSREDAPYPDELIRRAIERAVDGTDPRLRALPGYRKKLRTAVIHAIDHVVALIESLPPPVELSRASYSTDPELIAYFASAAHAQEVLTLDPALNQWRASPDSAAPHIIMLLAMEMEERNVFGMALEGDMLRRDVAQTTVNFAHHQLVDPAATEEDTRRLLKRRAFDHLLTLALKRITATQNERAGLELERSLLRRKCSALAAGCWGFDKTESGAPPDPQALQQQLEEIESQLQAAGAGASLLDVHLDIVVDVLTQAEKNFWIDRSPLIINRMHVKQAQASARSPEINLTLLRGAAGRSLVARLVTIAREELPPQRDFMRETERYFG
jgi:hypothetical protein